MTCVTFGVIGDPMDDRFDNVEESDGDEEMSGSILSACDDDGCCDCLWLSLAALMPINDLSLLK